MNLLDLVTRDTVLKRMATTHGGEYAGPCPFCGGRDRFRVWPNMAQPRYWCRGCRKSGDAIQYLRDHDQLSFVEARAQVGMDNGVAQPGTRWPRRQEVYDEPHFWPASDQEAAKEPPLSPDGSPISRWQEAAKKLCAVAEQTLWMADEHKALDYLHRRGLRDETIRQAGLGYWPSETYAPPEQWGFASTEKKIWEPAGIVIPWTLRGTYWRVRIRALPGTVLFYRYVQIYGSQNALYRADAIRADLPVVMVEGEIDALTIAQEVDRRIAVVATGSTEGARRTNWLATLASASRVLLAFDADHAGDTASQWWLSRLDNAKRWRPFWNDPNDLLQDGIDLSQWVEAGLR